MPYQSATPHAVLLAQPPTPTPHTTATSICANSTHQYCRQNSVRTDSCSQTQQEQKSVLENTTYRTQQYRGPNSIPTDASYRTQQDRILFLRMPLLQYATTQEVKLQKNQRMRADTEPFQ
ncbi:Hypothetical predicted protein, partial [Pelobates cultripes]